MKKKVVVGIAILVILITGVIIAIQIKSPFSEYEDGFFLGMAKTNDAEDIEVLTLDAYYLETEDKVFYNIKYRMYFEADRTWYEVDQVKYGVNGEWINAYCLSWDQLYGYEDVNAVFERAKKEGVHKTYTKEEIEKRLAEAYDALEKERAE